MKIAITGGGSAGHVVPALAVAARLPDHGADDIVYFGRPGSIEADLATRAGLRLIPVPAAGLKRYRSWRNVTMPLTVARGILTALATMRRERPDVLISKGGYVAVPAGIAAALYRIPLVLHESDHTLGLAHRILSPLATHICLTTPARTRRRAARTTVTGLPLRPDLATGRPERLRARLSLPRDVPVLLVFCGSHGSQRINTAIRAGLDRLTERFAVLHICGPGNLDPALDHHPRYRQAEYLHEEMTDALHLAELVVGRAGATTLAELAALDKPAVLVPLPARVSRGDQIANAAAHARRHPGRCTVVPDDTTLTLALADACLTLADNAGAAARPDPQAVHRAAHHRAHHALTAPPTPP
ncbi:glycosyltransferase, partial [Streptomyces sp. NPDC057638]|uniref:UDP-N-acetylglucosamine--N-acetylmuramyl- (pentapeptide) pyrophosphoryl-undecaprenol N-acetylglucosamine transferase n=1 Tax=Streptomyces sp. NPDC057638 TaxID=3346190 RepID=UPI0036CC6045